MQQDDCTAVGVWRLDEPGMKARAISSDEIDISKIVAVMFGKCSRSAFLASSERAPRRMRS